MLVFFRGTFFSYLCTVGTLRHSDRIHDHLFVCWRRWRCSVELISPKVSSLQLEPGKNFSGASFSTMVVHLTVNGKSRLILTNIQLASEAGGIYGDASSNPSTATLNASS